MISILMLKICGESLHKPSEYTFRASLNYELFLSERKKANLVSIYKKYEKKLYAGIFTSNLR